MNFSNYDYSNIKITQKQHLLACTTREFDHVYDIIFKQHCVVLIVMDNKTNSGIFNVNYI